jgi:ribosomal protein L6P/L9E
MSRIGRKPIPVAKGVKIEKHDVMLKMTGPKGTLSAKMPSAITV